MAASGKIEYPQSYEEILAGEVRKEAMEEDADLIDAEEIRVFRESDEEGERASKILQGKRERREAEWARLREQEENRSRASASADGMVRLTEDLVKS